MTDSLPERVPKREEVVITRHDKAVVADASVAIGWVHPAQATKQTAAMLDAIAEGATLEVPALWPGEVANALILLVRRRKLAEDERRAGLEWLHGLRRRVDHEMSALAFSRLAEQERSRCGRPGGGQGCDS